jgi:type I restriction enzyme S subunit
MEFELLGNICEVVRGSSPRPQGDKRYYGGNIPRLMIADVTRDKKYVTPIIDSLTEEGAAKSRPMKKGDLIIAVSGDPGRVCFLNVDACIHDGFVGLRKLDESKYDKEFLYYYLTFFKSSMKHRAYGAIFQNITTDILKGIKIPKLSISAQNNIAKLASKAENLIAQRKESIRLLDEFLKSTFLEMFGDNTTDDKGWNKISLIEGCESKKDVKCGPFGTQLSKSEYQENGIPVWGIPQINSEFKILPKEFVTKEKATELDEYSVVPNDIVMSRKGNVGKCSLFPKGFSKGVIHSDVLRIRTDFKKIHPVFLLFQLKHSKKIEIQIKGVTKGAIMAGINVGLLKHIIIDQPPIELQIQFARIVEKTEALKSQYQHSLQELEHLYGSLSQRAFKGELGI